MATVMVAAPAASATKYVDNFLGNPTIDTSVATGGLFNQPGGVAIDSSTGAVYVVDRGNRRVQQFDAANNFVRAWGTDVVKAGAPNDVSASAFEVCDTQHPSTPNTAADCKAGISSGAGTGGELGSPQGVAVNQSTGHVYVTDGDQLRIQEFTATGEFVRAWGQDVIVNAGTPPNGNGSGFEVCDTQHPTTPNTAADCKAGAAGTAGGAFASTFDGYPSVVPAGAPNAGNVLVADPGNQRVQEFTATGSFVRTFGFDVVQPGGTGEQVGASLNERQTVALSDLFGFGAVLGGTFTLTFDVQTTGPIDYNASPNAVRNALQGLSSVGAGNVAVTGSGPWTIEFVDTLGGIDVASLTGDGSGLTTVYGLPAVDVATATSGGPGPAFEICTVAAECQAGGTGDALGQFAAGQPKRAVADSAGAVYTAESTGNFRVQKFSGPSLIPALFANQAIGAADSSSEAVSDLAFDASTGRMLVVAGRTLPAGACPAVRPQALIFELTTGGALIDTHGGCTDIGQQTGLAVRPSNGRLYLAAQILFTGPSSAIARHRVWMFDADGITPAIATINPATNVSSSGADLSAAVNPNSVDNQFAPTLWKLQYSRNGVDWSTASSGSIATAGTTPVTVTGSADGLSPNTSYRLRVLTQKPFGNLEVPSAELTLLTDAVPAEIRTTATQSVKPTEASVSARINPHGTPTSYRFEWGEQGQFDHVAPALDAVVGSGPSFVLVSQQLTGLKPGTTYQYRAVAISASEGTTVGPTKTFTTPTQQVAGPQGRAYELVSPADKIGGSGLGPWYGGVGSHGNSGVPAYDGERFASQSYLGGSLVDGGFSYGGDWTLGERTPAGWINKPGMNRPGGFGSSEFARIPMIGAMSDDLSLTAWEANGQIRIFQGQDDVFGDFAPADGALRDWESGHWEIIAPFAADQLAGAFPIDGKTVAGDGGFALFYGGSRGVAGPDDPTHANFDDDPYDWVPGNNNVYLDDVTAGLSDTFPGAGIRSLVGVCTGAGASRTTIPSVDGSGEIVADQCPAPLPGRAARMISPRGASLALKVGAPNHISRDGSRTFFMSPDHLNPDNLTACGGTGVLDTECPPQVYVSQRGPDGSVTTRWISRSTIAGQDANLLALAVFEGATPDGDKVFFRTATPLTADDPNGGETSAASPNSVDLYMYDLPDAPGADPGSGTLTRISAGPTGAGDGNVSTDSVATPSRALRAVGVDGSHVYFTTAAPLPGVPAPADGTITTPGGTVSQAGAKNLYSYDASLPTAQRWRFVAQLPASSPLGACATRGSLSNFDGLLAGGSGTGTNGKVETSPTANCVRTVTDGSLISFFTDGRLTDDDPDSTSGDAYVYDADADELTRISAAQGGIGGSYVCVTETASAALGTRCNGDPVISSVGSQAPLQLISDPADPSERTVFFESASRLVPEDHNDVYDVYQWRNGKLSLLSTGAEDADDALYRGNDRSGRNVYISTRDALTWQDHDKVLDVYTARVGGGISQPDPPSVCSLLAGTCQAPPAGGVGVDAQSARPGGENAASGSRMRLTVVQLSAKARRQAARRGVIAIRVRSDAAGTASVVATARVGKKTRTVAQSKAIFAKADAETVALRLNRVARRRLAAGRLQVRVRVSAPGARQQSLSILLPRRAGR